MPHPAFVIVVGIGLGAILYYMFADSNNRQQHTNCNGTSPAEDLPNPWRSGNSDNNCRSRSKRKDPVANDKECSICLTNLSTQQAARIIPCLHFFHRKCIAHWQEHSNMENHDLCPNCRTKIEGIHEIRQSTTI